MTRLRVIGAALALLVVTGAGDAAAQRRRVSTSGYESRVDTTFAFDKNGSLAVNATSGDVVIIGWPRNEMKIRAVSDDDNIRFSASSSRVTLGVAGGRRGGDTRFEVSVPYGVRVTAETYNGDLTIKGTRGQVEAHARQSGDIQIDDVSTRLDITALSGDIIATGVNGDATISSLSGNVRLTDVKGSIDVGTVSGDIALRGVTAKVVRVKTTSGEIGFDGAIDPAGRYDLNTHSGDIELRIPRDASAQLTVSTWTGSINPDFPITLKPGEHSISSAKSKRYVFDIGGGSARISAETFSGDITISSIGRGARERQ